MALTPDSVCQYLWIWQSSGSGPSKAPQGAAPALLQLLLGWKCLWLPQGLGRSPLSFLTPLLVTSTQEFGTQRDCSVHISKGMELWVLSLVASAGIPGWFRTLHLHQHQPVATQQGRKTSAPGAPLLHLTAEPTQCRRGDGVLPCQCGWVVLGNSTHIHPVWDVPGTMQTQLWSLKSNQIKSAWDRTPECSPPTLLWPLTDPMS